MIVRFSASNIVAMILFIPMLIALGIIMAFIIPLFAIIISVAGIAFTMLYVFARIGMARKQQETLVRSKKKAIEVKHYKIR